jgi:hypothetical protein
MSSSQMCTSKCLVPHKYRHWHIHLERQRLNIELLNSWLHPNLVRTSKYLVQHTCHRFHSHLEHWNPSIELRTTQIRKWKEFKNT